MQKNLVRVENVNGVLVTTSNRVADELGVRHKNLLAKIDEYVEKFNEINGSEGVAKSLACLEFYIPSECVNQQNKQTYRNYLITKKGIAQLIGGYSAAVPKAFDLNVAYINKFEEMEKALQSKKDSYMIEDPIERAKRWIEEQEEAKRLIDEAKLNERVAIEVKDRVVSAVKNLVESGNGYTISEVAKVLCFKGLGELNMFKYLRNIGMLCSDRASWNEPTSVAISSNRMYVDIKNFVKNGVVENYTQTKITKKGILWLYDRLIKEGYKTIIDRNEVEDLFI